MKIQSSISFGEKITEIPQVRYAQVSLSGTVFAFSYLIAFRLDCKKKSVTQLLYSSNWMYNIVLEYNGIFEVNDYY